MTDARPPLDEAFAAAMDRLGPFGNPPRLAVAVSGGADSTALALLARDWAAARGGAVVALIVDHGLRADSAAEAALTADRLAERGIAARVITLAVPNGPALQARARAARFAALAEAARAAGCVHLLLGHHESDQAETVAMRAARGGGGLEGIAAWSARHDIVIIRPLLTVPPLQLRAFLRANAMVWVEDPSNADRRFERVRMRQASQGAAPDSARRRRTDADVAAFLAGHAVLRPEGFAVIAAPAMPEAALAALLRVIGGRLYAPAREKVAALAAALRPATLGGVRIAPAGRLGAGWLLAREPAACAVPVAAAQSAVWDGRFRLVRTVPGASLGALGGAASKFRENSDLPALVLRGMPCLRDGAEVVAFPAPAIFAPPGPAASHPFLA